MTIIEFLVAIVLSSFIMSSIYGIYATQEKSTQMQFSLQQVQYRSLKSLQILANEIKQAGSLGCQPKNTQTKIINLPTNILSTENKLTGNANEFTVRYIKSLGIELIANLSTPDKLVFSTKHVFHPGEILALSNCDQAELWEVREVAHLHQLQYLTPGRPVKILLQPAMKLGKLMVNHFYLDQSALYMENIAGQKLRLVEGVYALQFQYYIRHHQAIDDSPLSVLADSRQLAAVGMAVTVGHAGYKKTWYGFAGI